jgi:hypothetical protein
MVTTATSRPALSTVLAAIGLAALRHRDVS